MSCAGSKQNRYEGLVGTDEPYFGSSDAESFASDVEGEDGEEHKRKMEERKKKKRLIFDPTAKKITWELGLIFENVDEFGEAVAKYAIQKRVQIEKYINEPHRVRVRCMVPKCGWLVAASKDGRSNNFKVKRYNPVHKCYTTNKNKLCNSRYLAKRYKSRIMSQPGMRVWELRKLIKQELDLYVGRSTTHRARAKILKEIIGEVHQEFKRLYDYRDMILQTNPGSTCVVKAEDQGDGKLVFSKIYVCLHAMKRGWLEGWRRIIGLDGCFLKGVCKGQLLVAVSKDGNNQMFPIAWAVLEVENTLNWTWILKWLSENLGLEDGRDLTMMSNMQKGLINAVRDLLPECEHRMCARHILANWSKEWRRLKRRTTFWRCARASSIAELNDQLDMLDKLGDGICESLLHYKKETWCRAYFNCDRKCDIIDNNMCETLNSWILAERHKTIITMLEEIKIKLMIRIGKMREFWETWICDISPIAMKIYRHNLAKSMKCTPRWNGETGYEIEDPKYKHVVSLVKMTCSCRAWQLKGIPCYHAIARMHFKDMEAIHHIAHWYRKSTYLKAYSTFIQPVPCMKQWPPSGHPPIEPPPIRNIPSRPKKNRKREETEHPKSGKLSRRGMEMACSLCGMCGHNKRGCPGKKSASGNAAPGNATATNATAGNGRGRGRARGTSTTTTSSSQSARGKGVSATGRGVRRGRGSRIGLFQARNGVEDKIQGSLASELRLRDLQFQQRNVLTNQEVPASGGSAKKP
ncbi:PREDICTED: uncharacterized protein LOC109227781 [Nicotiana attenuata]|uniref:uncharacterized protein LOC109227781 n=1 Tax=Nicotiana attenuata TaxID=49451 RepID=UPI0009050D1A|nr:PREDICTED: uncharacterized protein LOC109227781 [Nicotiana attenuata]